MVAAGATVQNKNAENTKDIGSVFMIINLMKPLTIDSLAVFRGASFITLP